MQEPNVSVRHIPYANRDLVQFGGRGNYTLTIPVRVDNNNDVSTFQSLVDGNPHTLVYNGVTYNNVYLIRVGKIEQMGIGTANPNWTAELSFIRQGA